MTRAREEKLLTLPEVAELLGVSRVAVYGAVKAGKLPARRVGKLWVVRESDVRAYEPRAYPRDGRDE